MTKQGNQNIPEKLKPKHKQDEFAIRKLEKGMEITRIKIKDLRIKR